MHSKLRSIVHATIDKGIKLFHLIRVNQIWRFFWMKFPVGYEWITAGYSTCEDNKKNVE